ncbi:MAG TPA: hypothetical protein VH682_01355 [Gemmataceae bacterium]|jgi:hypothetical protein
MRGKWFAAGALAVVGVLVWTVPSRAGDVVRLNGVGDAQTQNLIDDGQGADTIRTFRGGFGGFGRGFGGFGRGFGFGGFGRGFGFGGFNRGFGFGGFNRGFGFSGIGFGRGFGFGGFGFPGIGFGRGFGFGRGLGWGGLGWGGWGLGGWPIGGWGGWGVGGWPIGGWGGFWPCAGTTANVYNLSIPMATLGTPLNGAPQMPYTNINPPQAPRRDGTYPYDGGPKNAVPNQETTPPAGAPQRTVPLEGRTVSLPKAAGKWAYPAYGETARRTSSSRDQSVLVRSGSKKSTDR